MSTSTYLEICNEALKICEITETDMQNVVNQDGSNADVARWVADSDILIQREAWNWDFLYVTTFSQPTVAGISTYSPPSDLGQWDRATFWLNRTVATNSQLEQMEYRDYFNNFAPGVQTQAQPDHFIIQPTGDYFLYSEPDAVYTLTANYWKRPTKMAESADVSLIPEPYLHCIYSRVKMFYAIQQEVPLIYTEAEKEYKLALDELKYNQLPGWRGYGNADDVDLVVRPE